MSYLLQDRKRKAGFKDFFKAFLILLTLVIIYMLFKPSITSGLHSIQRGTAYVFGYYDDPVRPISQNSYIQALESENLALKEIIGRKMETEELLVSVVLSRPPHSPYDSLTIDIGEDKGLNYGDMVYAGDHYLIGRIEAVNPTTSIVKLFSSPGEKVDVLVGASSTSAVVAEGRGGGNFFIKVPRNIDIKEGDPIIVPSLHSIVLGTAEKVDADAGEAYTEIYFKLPININSLKYVQIKKILH